MKSGAVSIPWSLSLFFITITHLDAFSLKCQYQKCEITELRSPKETFLYRYFPDDVTDVVYTHLMVRHVNANILEGIGVGLEKNVKITASLKVQSVSLSSKCNIFFLVIERTGLREIEFEENDVLRELRILGSSLKSVPRTLRLLKNLLKVSITRSLIQHVDLSIFCGNANLDLVNLSSNRIRSIENNNRDSCKIRKAAILVEDNFLDSLDLELLDIFDIKNELSFGENQIGLLSRRFTSQTLKKLDLHDNRLHSLDICGWKTPSLSFLDLSSNFLTSVPQCLENLKNLAVFWLTSNRITSVSIESFATLWSLTNLSLGENNMTSIVLNSTRFPPQLQSLYIAGNLLTSLNLSYIPVQHLDVEVEHNLIANFDVNGTSPNVTRLEMACNPIDCSWNSPKEKETVICTRYHEDPVIKKEFEKESKLISC